MLDQNRIIFNDTQREQFEDKINKICKYSEILSKIKKIENNKKPIDYLENKDNHPAFHKILDDIGIKNTGEKITIYRGNDDKTLVM